MKLYDRYSVESFLLSRRISIISSNNVKPKKETPVYHRDLFVICIYIYIIFTRSFPTVRFLEIRDGFEFANKEESIDRTFLFNLILRNSFSLARYRCLHNSSLPLRRKFFNSGLIGLKGYIPL